MELDPQQTADLTDALRPSAADVLAAKQVVLESFGEGRFVNVDSVLEALCQREGVDPLRPRGEQLDVGGQRRGLERDFDPRAAPILRERFTAATVEAFADLITLGQIVQVDADRQVQLTVQTMGYSGGVSISDPRPRVSGTYRLARPLLGDVDFRFFDPDLYLEGIDNLLGPRGGRCLREALDAYRRGLYLSTANMLGAASEAAWYTIAEELRGSVVNLDVQLDGGVTAQVIKLTGDDLHDTQKKLRTTIRELLAHTAHLRDLRNYGIHPRSEADEDHEGAYTETGCALLLMESRRYFVRLHSVAVAAELLAIRPVSS